MEPRRRSLVETTRREQTVLTLVLGVGVAAFVHAQTQSLHATAVPVSTEPGLKITLRVNNYAHIPPALLSHAEEEATTIFRQAGVEAAWVDCPLSGAELDRFPACQQPMGGADFALRILSAAMARTPRLVVRPLASLCLARRTSPAATLRSSTSG